MKWLILLGAFLGSNLQANPVSKQDLAAMQAELKRLESSIHNAKQTTATLNSELGRLEKLLKLQELEIKVSAAELDQLEEKVQEMRIRLSSLEESIQSRKKRVRDLLSVLPSLEYKTPIARLTENNRMFVVMFRESVGKLLAYEKSEMLALQKYLLEAEELSTHLEAERDRLAAKTDDLREKQTILSLNKNLKKDLLRRTETEQSQRMTAYQAAKAAEAELEEILNKVKESPAISPVTSTASAPVRGRAAVSFAQRKGKLPRPVLGEIVSSFGKKYDPNTSLYTFHKGLAIQAKPSSEVNAVFPGRVAFAGIVNGYGQLLIIDHGDDYFTLLGQLGEVFKKSGDSVAEGELVGKSNSNNTPVYFEIRQRHIAVNPAPWFNES